MTVGTWKFQHFVNRKKELSMKKVARTIGKREKIVKDRQLEAYTFNLEM